jgi:hypothetical protein
MAASLPGLPVSFVHDSAQDERGSGGKPLKII